MYNMPEILKRLVMPLSLVGAVALGGCANADNGEPKVPSTEKTTYAGVEYQEKSPNTVDIFGYPLQVNTIANNADVELPKQEVQKYLDLLNLANVRALELVAGYEKDTNGQDILVKDFNSTNQMWGAVIPGAELFVVIGNGNLRISIADMSKDGVVYVINTTYPVSSQKELTNALDGELSLDQLDLTNYTKEQYQSLVGKDPFAVIKVTADGNGLLGQFKISNTTTLPITAIGQLAPSNANLATLMIASGSVANAVGVDSKEFVEKY
jgi:hypothetical protein